VTGGATSAVVVDVDRDARTDVRVDAVVLVELHDAHPVGGGF